MKVCKCLLILIYFTKYSPSCICVSLLRPISDATGLHSRHLVDIFSGKRFYAFIPQSETDLGCSCASDSADSLIAEIGRLKRLVIAYPFTGFMLVFTPIFF